MALILRSLSQSACVFRQTSCLVARRTVTNTATRNVISKGENVAYREMEHYWSRNRALNRPISPFLSTYKYHLTMLISITNRVTGVALQAGMTLGGVIMLLTSKKYPECLKQINSSTIGSAILSLFKLGIATFFAFHLIAGSRHLIWDAGMGYSKAMTIRGSYAVMGITLALTLLLMVVKPPMPQV